VNAHAGSPVRRRVMVWQWDDDDELWRRYYLRELASGKVMQTELIRVDRKRPVCMNCLSHAVEVAPPDAEGVWWLRCRRCEARYHIL
jgi:hypothetical protein